MSIIQRVLIAASVIVAATAAQAQDRGAPTTTYIGGPKSHLTKTTYGAPAPVVAVRPHAAAAQAGSSGGANAIGVDNAARSYARVVPVRQRASAVQAGFSGGANAIGVDNAARSYARAVPVRQRAERPAPVRGRIVGLSAGARAIGADDAK